METVDERRDGLWAQRGEAAREWSEQAAAGMTALAQGDYRGAADHFRRAAQAAEQAHALGHAIMALDAAEMVAAQVRRAC